MSKHESRDRQGELTSPVTMETASPAEMGAAQAQATAGEASPEGRPTDWWRCRRRGPVSGRFYGETTAPHGGLRALDLRVDIDARYPNSPVMEVVSGDVYRVYRFNWWQHKFHWTVYEESWVVENPTINWDNCSVEITGKVKFWKGGHAPTDLHIKIPWTAFTAIGPAEVTFDEAGGSRSRYTCAKRSNAFREVRLEIDVCDSVNAEPIVPDCDTHAHPTRPVGLPQRTLTIEESYLEAGIDLTINPTRTIIDDSVADFDRWSPAELHDAMEQYFSNYPGTWPKWHMWCLLAGTFDSPSVGGIMFDAKAAFGGAGQPPERQGCAVFREHSWFDNLVPTPPSNDDEAWAVRHYLYTYVHEIGHAFNFLHSWDKGRADSLSWMNYDWRYDSLPGNSDGDFWGNFLFRFDDDELMHMRHGDRAAVIMGGDPWASGGHLEAPSGAMADILGEAPVELLLRSKNYFQFMEPVIVEMRIRNKTGMAIELDTQLHPEYGSTSVYIRRPDGSILQFEPIMCKLAMPELKVLEALNGNEKGEDRHSQNVLLSYGAYGYYFDEPGEYLVRAMYQGNGGVLIPSNIHRIRVGHPFTREEDRLAQDFFSYEAGMALYLDGSSSPFLEKGMDTLRSVAEQAEAPATSAQLSLVLAQNLARPFFRIEDTELLKARDAQPREALELTAQALEKQEDDQVFTNISYHQLRRTRADLMVAMDEKDDAKKELSELIKDLRENGVNQPVLDDIQAYSESL